MLKDYRRSDLLKTLLCIIVACNQYVIRGYIDPSIIQMVNEKYPGKFSENLKWNGKYIRKYNVSKRETLEFVLQELEMYSRQKMEDHQSFKK